MVTARIEGRADGVNGLVGSSLGATSNWRVTIGTLRTTNFRPSVFFSFKVTSITSTTSHVGHQFEAKDRQEVEEKNKGDDEEDRKEAGVVVWTAAFMATSTTTSTKEKAKDEAKDADDPDDRPEETSNYDVRKEDGRPVEESSSDGQELKDDDGSRDKDDRLKMIKIMVSFA